MDAAVKPLPDPGQPVEKLVVFKPDRQVQIGRGEYASLGALMSNRDPHCNLCTDGWVRRVKRPGHVNLEVCGCCVARFRKHRDAARRDEADRETIAVAPPGLAHQRERLDRRVTRLTTAVTRIEEQITRREAGLAQAIEGLQQEARGHAAAAQDHAATALKARADVQRLEAEIAETERHLIELRQKRQGAMGAADADERAVELAAALHQDIEERIGQRREAFAGETRSLRREIDKARRRLATAVAYNHDVIGAGAAAAAGGSR
jgi:hypothetical protein